MLRFSVIQPVIAMLRVCRILHGFDVLDRMETVKVDAKNKPIADIRINSIVIHANPIADSES